MSDPTEAKLLGDLAGSPGDDSTRMVYADWLEQHGEVQRAKFVRGDDIDAPGIVAASTEAWRAIASRGKLVCAKANCPGTWDRLAPTELERVRSCATCDTVGVYCVKPPDATAAIERRLVITTDPPPTAEARAAMDKAIDYGQHPYKYRTMNPPPPGTPMPPPKTPLQRAREVLRK